MQFLRNNWQTLLIFFIVLIVIILNFFFCPLAINFIFICFAVGAILFRKQRDFLKEWFLPLSLFYLYELIRGKGFEIATYLHRPMLDTFLINIDKRFFGINGEIPSVFLQYSLSNAASGNFSPSWYDFVLFFFYASFFWFWILTAAIAWKKGKEFFYKYIYGILAFSLLDNLIFIFFPSAPPWYAAQEGLLPPLQRLMISYDFFAVKYLALVRTYEGNYFAAFPSHHAAWSFFSALFLVYMFGKKALPIFIVPLLIIFATWYGAEHYVIDSLVGCAIASVAFIFAILNYKKIFKNIV